MVVMKYQRDTLLKDIRENVVEVHFIKVDGEQRVIRCTLQPELLPELYRTNIQERKEEQDFHLKNPDVISAWDVNAGGWRSFRIDSVFYVQVIDNY
jgi:WYL_2, Sm-like SH3 beta-barrel fold